MSWNVFLRPAILNDQQMDRVDSVAAYIEDSGVDVLVLQEVFHKRARKRLCMLLDSSYPYYTGRGPKSIWGVPSGVVIFSKYPIQDEEAKSFKKGKGSDGLARKGVVRTAIQLDNSIIEIYGTHMQAGGGVKRDHIRQQQLDVIKEFAENGIDSLPQLFAGDFNISHTTAASDSILEKLDTKLPEISGNIKYTANFNDQDLMAAQGKPQWIDFILLKDRGIIQLIETEIQSPRMRIGEDSLRISDHNPIISEIVLY